MILITGGTGLVGSHLLYSLAREGKRVRAVYRNQDRIQLTKKIFGYYVNKPESLLKNIDWVKSDLNDVPNLEIAFEGITQVYHCAALISFDPRDKKKLYRTNVLGTENIVNLCIHYKIEKLCHVSSIATIGKPSKKELATEQTEFNDAVANVYALSKYQAEMEVWRGSQEGVKIIIVNPGVIIGPGFWSNGSGTLFKKIHNGLKFYPKGKAGFVSVSDVVNAMMVLMNSELMNQRYILVSNNLSYLDAFSRIADQLNVSSPESALKNWMLPILWRLDWLKSSVTGQPRLLSKRMAESLKFTTDYDNSKIKKDLNFEFSDLNKNIKFCAATFLEENR